MTDSGFPAPELLRRLTRLERHEIRRVYALRLAESGLPKAGRIDREAFSTTMNRAFRLGVLWAIFRVMVPAAMVFMLADVSWLHLDIAQGLVSLAGLILLGGGFFGMRLWQLRRYLARHSVEPAAAGPAPGAVTAERYEQATGPVDGFTGGHPRVVAPELWARLSRPERYQAGRFYRKYLVEARAAGNVADDGDPGVDIARRAIVSGAYATAAFASIVPYMAVVYALAGALRGHRAELIVTAVSGSILVGIVTLALLRRRQVNRYFAATF